jgi:hypothetical protein
VAFLLLKFLDVSSCDRLHIPSVYNSDKITIMLKTKYLTRLPKLTSLEFRFYPYVSILVMCITGLQKRRRSVHLKSLICLPSQKRVSSVCSTVLILIDQTGKVCQKGQSDFRVFLYKVIFET